MSDQLNLNFKTASDPANKVPTKAPVSTAEKPVEKPKTLSVSQLNQNIKSLLEGEFSLIWVKGEISNFTAHGSGHLYFSLKDSKSQLSAVMFRGSAAHLNFRPKVGDEVLVRARVSVYIPRGNYQVIVEVMEPVGAGAMQRKFEELKDKLLKEGLFAAERKQPLPAHPQRIAVITSPTGAAFQDILNVLKRRYSAAEILLIPAVVQGEAAAPSLRKSVDQLSRLKNVDVAIIGRGGGSMEDLWAFNDEVLARAIAKLDVPIVSAVGHEIDFTICDFVSDMRAPTPSAAAELVVASVEELATRLKSQHRQLFQLVSQHTHREKTRLNYLANRLVHPSRRLQELAQRCDELQQKSLLLMNYRLRDFKQRVNTAQAKLVSPQKIIEFKNQKLVHLHRQLAVAVVNQNQHRQDKLQKSMGLLDSLSPLRVLDRGYSVTTDPFGHVVDPSNLNDGEEISTHFSGHTILSKITKVEKGSKIWDLRKNSKDSKKS